MDLISLLLEYYSEFLFLLSDFCYIFLIMCTFQLVPQICWHLCFNDVLFLN